MVVVDSPVIVRFVTQKRSCVARLPESFPAHTGQSRLMNRSSQTSEDRTSHSNNATGALFETIARQPPGFFDES
jgi:hypothetical protein